MIAGTGSNSTAEAVRLTRAAEEAGAAGALLISPYYNKPTQDGIYQHYAAVAEATKLPLIVYNIPGRTASNILPETIARLSRIKNIVGVKEASGSIAAGDRDHRLGRARLRRLVGRRRHDPADHGGGGRRRDLRHARTSPRGSMVELTDALLAGDLAARPRP